MGATTDLRTEQLAWDSEWWGVPVWKTEVGAALDTWAQENTRGCLWLLIPARDTDDIRRAEQGGARLVDVRVMLDCNPWEEQYEHTTHPLATPFIHSEVDALAAISRSAFRGLTRFYADPMFPDERCDDLYENWLRQSCDGWAKEVLVARVGGSPVGFVTVHLDGEVASIGLIAVEVASRGLGFGAELCWAAIYWALQQKAARMTVVTQGCNIPAQRTFQAAGFRTSDVSVWLHKWAEK